MTDTQSPPNQNLENENTQENNKTGKETNNTTGKDSKDSGSWSYITYGVLIVFIIVILYYAYNKFVSNADVEEKEEEVEKERKVDTGGNIVPNYDIEFNISQLEKQQDKVLKGLSQNSGIRNVELIINDTPTRNNKDLIDFLHKNLDTIVVRARIKLKFNLAKPHDISSFRDRGLTKFPALIDDGDTCVGVTNIVENLRKRVRSSKRSAPPKNETEVLNEFMHAEAFQGVGKTTDGVFEVPKDDDEDDIGTQLEQQAMRESSRRKQNGKGIYNGDVSTSGASNGTANSAKKSGKRDLNVRGPDRDQSEDIRANFRDRGRPDNVSTSSSRQQLTGDDLLVQQMLEKNGSEF